MAVIPIVPTKTVTAAYPTGGQFRRITSVSSASGDGSRKIGLADGTDVIVNLATYTVFAAQVGDYYVTPQEGNAYLIGKATFAQTYTVSF